MGDLAPELEREVAEQRRAPFDLSGMSWPRLRELITEQEAFSRFAPEGVWAADPRDGGVTLYNERRARRPHDYTSRERKPKSPERDASPGEQQPPCPICSGKTTPIVDIRELSEGFTFINTNLYPILAPSHAPGASPPLGPAEHSGEILGGHFLQWTSSRHEVDWPELSTTDRGEVLARLAELEQRLLELPEFPDGPEGRFVSIIKNVGSSVGGSLSHGHQQISLSSVMPKRVRDNRSFLERRGEPFSRYLRRENPKELTVVDTNAGTLLVPFFMRRPYDMQFLLSNDGPAHLHQLSRHELEGVGDALALGMRLMRSILLSLEREIAYNVLVHTGPGAGIYLEFLPWTQENGGYEQLGLSACQSLPKEAARILTEAL